MLKAVLKKRRSVKVPSIHGTPYPANISFHTVLRVSSWGTIISYIVCNMKNEVEHSLAETYFSHVKLKVVFFILLVKRFEKMFNFSSFVCWKPFSATSTNQIPELHPFCQVFFSDNAMQHHRAVWRNRSFHLWRLPRFYRVMRRGLDDTRFWHLIRQKVSSQSKMVEPDLPMSYGCPSSRHHNPIAAFLILKKTCIISIRKQLYGSICVW